jgi:drug/metabolite transporter (DMT)-like permease
MNIARSYFTACGIIAIFLWAINIYFLKCTLDIYGYVAGIGFIYLFGGIFGLSIELVRNNFTLTFGIDSKFIFVSSLLLINFICSSLSFGTSPANEVLLQVIIISDLWVILINILLVRINHYTIKNKLIFGLGIILGITGIVIACVGFDLSNINFVKYFAEYWYCYLFAIATAISWSCYTAYVKKYGEKINDNHLFLTMFISGFLLIPFSFASNSFNNYGRIDPNFEAVGLMIYEIIISCYLSYYLWNIGYKHGSAKTLSNVAILAPLLNVIFTSALYGLNVMYNIIVGATLLVSSIACCRYSIESPGAETTGLLNKLIDQEAGL